MLLTKADTLPVGGDWIYEPKLDGWRILAYTSPEQTTLVTRSERTCTSEFPVIVDQLQVAVHGLSAVLDGEMLGFIEGNQHNVHAVHKKNTRKVYCVFDLLELGGEPLIRYPWQERRRLLEEVLTPQDGIQLCEYDSDLKAMQEAAQELGLEGVVAKRITSRYSPGMRSKNWYKWKFNPHARGWKR